MQQSEYQQQLHQLIQSALAEDIGSGDYSTLSIVDAHATGKAILKVKQPCILAGVQVAKAIFTQLQPDCIFTAYKNDGDAVQYGDIAFEIQATIHTLLSGERLALNCMQRMSGIASLTHTYVQALEGFSTKILDTRKTTPNFRLLEKEAVRIGGGTNHRFALYDMMMLKDNHIDFAGGIAQAIDKAFGYKTAHNLPIAIELETRSLADVALVLQYGAGKIQRIMLDNFTPALVKEAVVMIDGQFETEASGGITLHNLQQYAAAGVTFISVGALIHQAQSVDLSLKAVI
ncbi:MAG: carboxylating nicotinate-nucleotide diphosphorylase [Bacteroidetes bacterium]|nr:MAG: carboxylating nicotinate-nucleotide diphosphorylase [Bacteroidota bacterium]